MELLRFSLKNEMIFIFLTVLFTNLICLSNGGKFSLKPHFSNYCSSQDQCKTICNCELFPNCSVLPLDETVRKTILFYHNQIRDIQSSGQPQPSRMTMLKYDMELEEISKCWAARCDTEFSTCFKTPKFNETSQSVGGLILEKKESPNVFLWLQMISYWLGQADVVTQDSIHTYPIGEKLEIMHNFAQLMSDKIHSIGCAWSQLTTDNWLMFVCTYGPRGALPGEPIFEIGYPCSRCPREYSCDYTKPFENLCKPKVRPPKPPKLSLTSTITTKTLSMDEHEGETQQRNSPPIPVKPWNSEAEPKTYVSSLSTYGIPEFYPFQLTTNRISCGESEAKADAREINDAKEVPLATSLHLIDSLAVTQPQPMSQPLAPQYNSHSLEELEAFTSSYPPSRNIPAANRFSHENFKKIMETLLQAYPLFSVPSSQAPMVQKWPPQCPLQYSQQQIPPQSYLPPPYPWQQQIPSNPQQERPAQLPSSVTAPVYWNWLTQQMTLSTFYLQTFKPPAVTPSAMYQDPRELPIPHFAERMRQEAARTSSTHRKHQPIS